jgi:hypothetical protein
MRSFHEEVDSLDEWYRKVVIAGTCLTFSATTLHFLIHRLVIFFIFVVKKLSKYHLVRGLRTGLTSQVQGFHSSLNDFQFHDCMPLWTLVDLMVGGNRQV